MQYVISVLAALFMGAGFSTATVRAQSVDDIRSPKLSSSFEFLADSIPTGDAINISTQFPAPDAVPGVSGMAWRTDGFSSWASSSIDLSGAQSVTISTWLILESYPSDLEVPVNRLSPSSIANQTDGRNGFDLYIDTYGHWGFWVSTTRGRIEVAAPSPLPKYEWAHIAARIDHERGTASLFLNGVEIAAKRLRQGAKFRSAQAPLVLARSAKEVEFLNFTINRLNAAYDELTLYDRALTDAEINSHYQQYAASLPDPMDSIAVPESRFSGDHLRPRFHAMPPANWTNEPHGMVRNGDTWHLFYQRTPNGPYKTQMHWGHMASQDLLTWRHLPDALWPELQTDDFGFDQKGIWSGDVIIDGGKAFAFYTSVNHSERLKASNPGVAMAVSEDPEFRTWSKMGPIINTRYVNDFRDPYLFRSGGTWHMIIGAALASGGGLDYWVLEAGEDGGRWSHREDFVSERYGRMDVGSVIWEMPVFEPLTNDVWVLSVAPIGGDVSKYGDMATRSVYWTGRWDGEQFHPFSVEPKMLDLIPGHLAPTVERAEDGRLRAIGIVDERRSPQSQEDAGWAHTFSFPRVWFLMPDGQTLGQAPAPELMGLRGEPLQISPEQPLTDASIEVANEHAAYELEVEFAQPALDGVIGLEVLVHPDGQEITRVLIDTETGAVTLDKSRSTLAVADEEGPRVLSGVYHRDSFGPIEKLRAYVDGSVVEVFVNDSAAFSFRAYPTRKEATGVRVVAADAALPLNRITLWPLRRPQ